MTDWHHFCDRLRALGDGIDSLPGVTSAQDRADGYRHLLGLLANSLQQSIELTDRRVPTMYRHNTDTIQWGAPNTDNTYWRARIDPAGTYRLTGRVPDGRPFLVQLPEGEMHLDAYGSAGEVTSDDLAVAADGTFELTVSAEPHPGNWLRIDGTPDHVSVREYFLDWGAEPGWFTIERLDVPDAVRERPSPDELAARLDEAMTWTEAALTYWPAWVARNREASELNRAAAPRSVPGGADNIAYGGIHYSLGPADALVIDLDAPVARYWSFVLYDPLWYTSPLFGQRQTSLNNAQVDIVDGRCRIVVAHEDPGWPNWLDTTGVTDGSIAYRYVWAETTPTPTVEVVPVADIRIDGDPAQRAAQLAARRLATQRRFR